MLKLTPPNHLDQFKKMIEDADQKFSDFYRKESYEDWDGNGFNVRQECKNYADLAFENLAKGNMHTAYQLIVDAISLEGDFCGWVDRRAYAEPREIFDEQIAQVKQFSLNLLGKDCDFFVVTIKGFEKAAEEWLQKWQFEEQISALNPKSDEEICAAIQKMWDIEPSPPFYFEIRLKKGQRGLSHRMLFDNK